MQMRELLGLRQEAIGEKLGLSQQSISKIEQKEEVDKAMLDKIAKAMGVTADAITNLDENATVYNVFHNSSVSGTLNNQNYNCTFNPFDKWAESIEENKKLYEELLKSEREKVAMLQKLLEGKK